MSDQPISVGDAPSDVLVAAGVVWTANERDGTLSRIDAGTGESLGETSRIDSGLVAITAGAGAIWAMNVQGYVVRVDAADGRVDGQRNLVSFPIDIAFAGDAVWVAADDGNTIVRIDPDSREAKVVIKGLDTPVAALAGAPGALWALSGDRVLRIDPATSALVGDPIVVGEEPVAIAASEKGAWVVRDGDDTVVRIDAELNEVVGLPTRVGHEPSLVAVEGDTVWVVNSGDGTVTRIDAVRNAVVGDPIKVGEGAAAIASGSGSVWVALASEDALVRIAPGAGDA